VLDAGLSTRRDLIFMSVARTRILGLLCLANLIGLLILGLWPFHSPRNQVRWLAERNGLKLGYHSAIRSAQPLKVSDSASISLELWLQPEEDDVGTIVSFYDSPNRVSFAVRQEGPDLMLQKQRDEPLEKTPIEKVYFDKILTENSPIFLTITSSPGSTTLYVNGELVRTLAGFSVSGKDLERTLLVGDSEAQPDGWVGEFRGLAIYSEALTAARAKTHFDSWIRSGRPDVVSGPAALYLFDERRGQVVHSTGSTQDELLIPAQYSILDKILLEMPWNAFRPDWDYWQDVAINVGGFIPPTFLAAAYFSLVLPRRAAFWAFLLGGLTSLTIESLQWFLPTRNSDMTDVLTNTLGAWIGVSMFRWTAARRLLDRFLVLCESLART
jgi:VanZ like family/Concanavalin A-like lectin/glucanases superfamily